MAGIIFLKTNRHESYHSFCSSDLPSFQYIICNQHKKYLKKKISDVVTLGTFCYRDQSFINRMGSAIFFTEGEVLNLIPHAPNTHTKQVEKILPPPRQNILKHLTPPPLPGRKQHWHMIIQFCFLVLLNISVQF